MNVRAKNGEGGCQRERGQPEEVSCASAPIEDPLCVRTMLVTDEAKRQQSCDYSFAQHIFILLFQ